jgi:uncharacterized protein YndB with AHSA1/START domain
MENLIAEETIEIEAPVSVIWELLTDPDKIKKWFPGKMDFKSEGILEMGNEMYWKNSNGKTFAKGTVIEIEPERYIRISMHFADWDKEADTDALTHIYSIFQKNKKIRLTHTYGDFAKVPGGKKLYEEYIATAAPGNTALKTIKEMAEE